MKRWLRRQIFHLWLALMDTKPIFDYTPGDCEPCGGCGMRDCEACDSTGWKDKVERL